VRTASLRTVNRLLSVLCLANCAVFLPPGAAAAELKGYAWICGENEGVNRICFWHKAAVTPPKGWIEDEAWTMRHQAVMLFENGDKSKAKPVMYVRTHNGDGALSLEHYITVAQERWLKRVPDCSIASLPNFERKDQPSFKIFLYKNPSQPEHAFELTAFMKDVDSAHPDETYFFQIVLSSPSMEELQRTKPAFYELLAKI
jgi:hypothetical protein